MQLQIAAVSSRTICSLLYGNDIEMSDGVSVAKLQHIKN